MTHSPDAQDPATDKEAMRFCASFARQSDESLLGKASLVQAYLLIEDPHAWSGPKDMVASALSDAARARVEAFKDHCPVPRVLFIKTAASRLRDERTVYLVIPAPAGGRLRRFTLPHLDALADLDLVAETLALAADPSAEAGAFPVLVCTNGKKDMCCAKFGGPAYCALDALLPDVWECTHTGGDRFAGNVVLPVSGQFFGFVLEDRAEAFAEAIRERRIPLDHFRGASFLAPPVQAAEVALRQRLHGAEMGRVVYAGPLPAHDEDDGGSAIHRPILFDWQAEQFWTVRVQKIDSTVDVPSNCSKGKTTRPWRMVFDGWRSLGADELRRLGLSASQGRLVRPARSDDWPWLLGNPAARERLGSRFGPWPSDGQARKAFMERIEAAALRLCETRDGARHLADDAAPSATLSA